MAMATKKDDVKMPSTLQRSPEKAQRTYAETLRNAEREYGPGERASRTAYGALKHSFEKVGDHWEAKDHKGPSDPRSAESGEAAHRGKGASYGGVDAIGNSRKTLYERARQAGIKGRSSMSKEDLAKALSKK
jgi:hypothetical protein